MKKYELLYENKSAHGPGYFIYRYEDFEYREDTWVRVAYGNEKNLLWVKSGKSFFELYQLFPAGKKIWVSLAEYESPNFDTEHIKYIRRNLFYVESLKPMANTDAKDCLENFINDSCKFYKFPKPNAIDYQSDGCYVNWAHKKPITKNEISKWLTVQKKFKEMFSFTGEYPTDPNYMVQCYGPDSMFTDWGYSDNCYPVYSFAE